MLHEFATAKGTIIMTAISGASYAFGVLADVITNETPISLGGALGIGAIVVGGAWYLSARLTKIEDKVKDIQKHVQSLPCGNGICLPKEEVDDE